MMVDGGRRIEGRRLADGMPGLKTHHFYRGQFLLSAETGREFLREEWLQTPTVECANGVPGWLLAIVDHTFTRDP